MIMFFLILTAVLLAMQYIALLWTVTNTSYISNNFWIKLLPLICTALFIFIMTYSRSADGFYAELAAQAMYIWLGTVFIWFSVAMAFMFCQIAAGFFKVSAPHNLSLYALALSVVLTLASLLTAQQTPSITKVDIKNPFAEGKALKIVQVSDTHLGIGVSVNRVKKLTALIQSLNPDIIVFTGDIFEETHLRAQEYTDAFKSLNPRYGKYAVLGNHEYYRSAQNNIDLWRKADIQPLLNNSAQAGGINIIGINDVKTSHINKAQFEALLTANTDKNKFNLLLSHTPLYFEAAADKGVNLMLSGHTHNGQIWPFNYLVKLSFKYVYGLYTYNNANIYVTSGAFFWGPPMRLFTKNEIALIKLS